MNAFEPSSCAPSARGPKHLSPAASKRSTMPRDERHLGSDDRRSATCSLPREVDRAPSKSVTAIGTLRVFASPPCRRYRARTSTSLTFGDCASFQASACSRPPLPMTRTFTAFTPSSVAEMPHAGEHHRHAVLVGGADDFVVAHRAARVARQRVRRARRPRRCRRGTGRRRPTRARRPSTSSLASSALSARDARAHDAARLAGADADRRAVAREHDRVRLHVLHDRPRKLAGRAALRPSAAAA